jgi:hypothetical protein
LREGKSFVLAVCANSVKSDAPIPFGFAPTAQRPKFIFEDVFEMASAGLVRDRRVTAG